MGGSHAFSEMLLLLWADHDHMVSSRSLRSIASDPVGAPTHRHRSTSEGGFEKSNSFFLRFLPTVLTCSIPPIDVVRFGADIACAAYPSSAKALGFVPVYTGIPAVNVVDAGASALSPTMDVARLRAAPTKDRARQSYQNGHGWFRENTAGDVRMWNIVRASALFRSVTVDKIRSMSPISQRNCVGDRFDLLHFCRACAFNEFDMLSAAARPAVDSTASGQPHFMQPTAVRWN